MCHVKNWLLGSDGVRVRLRTLAFQILSTKLQFCDMRGHINICENHFPLSILPNQRQNANRQFGTTTANSITKDIKNFIHYLFHFKCWGSMNYYFLHKVRNKEPPALSFSLTPVKTALQRVVAEKLVLKHTQKFLKVLIRKLLLITKR